MRLAVNYSLRERRDRKVNTLLCTLRRCYLIAVCGCIIAIMLISSCLVACTQTAPSAPTPPSAPITYTNEQEKPAPPIDRNMQKLIDAYPEWLERADGNFIVRKDGTRMVWDDGKGKKNFEALEADPDLEDMFAFAYPMDSVVFKPDFDPGRIRNEAFFKKMYGSTQALAAAQLVTVPWLKGAGTLRITRVNGVDLALGKVVADLQAMPAFHKYLTTPGGTFNWRMIAGTDRLSAHSFGMAVDINVGFSDYWRWAPEFKAGKDLKYHNQIPMEIVKVFERHGFIWGGKWYHYDTMHFEYRPELL